MSAAADSLRCGDMQRFLGPKPLRFAWLACCQARVVITVAAKNLQTSVGWVAKVWFNNKIMLINNVSPTLKS